jgi:hypothetical protein
MHSEDVKIADLIKKHLQTKEKTIMEGGRLRAESRKRNGEEDEAYLLSPPLRSVF